jgi:formylglycine-generating enzyme required for sulfatase activity
MRLFISYARVDKPYCVKIAETLDAHRVWYDDRLYVGQQWWKEILRRLDWCDGFIYLLSPESVASKYCRKEFAIAQNSGRKIFPVVIHEDTDIPKEINHIQYADLSNGLTPDAVKTLLNAIYLAEMQELEHPSPPSQPIVIDSTTEHQRPSDLASIVGKAAEAMETGKFDAAVYLLKQAQNSEYHSRFINLGVLLHEAETALEQQAYRRAAESEYKPIAELVKRRATQRMGCEAFQEFNANYPDYDPEGLTHYCSSTVHETGFLLPLLEWCDIPAGYLMLPPQKENNNNGHQKEHREGIYIDKFRMSKYPITNTQFQAFIDDNDGYKRDRWWDFSRDARKWRKTKSEPTPSRFQGNDRPRENITWYEAMAYCRWLQEKTGLTISLPTDRQWQRAARGNDDRLYPWGNHFDTKLANTRESKIRMTTQVTRHPNAISPFGIFDMSGNVWEWCLNPGTKDSRDQEGDNFRAICGGSHISDCKRAQTIFHFNLNPEHLYSTIGFRVMAIQ